MDTGRRVRWRPTCVEIENLHEAMNLYLNSSKKQKKSRLNQKMQELKEITQNSEEFPHKKDWIYRNEKEEEMGDYINVKEIFWMRCI